MGPIDVWVNVAFTSVFARFEDIAPEEYRRATEVTYLGYVWGTMAVLPRMKRRNRGTIVHVGSALAYRGIPLQTAYCGAKHATQGFHEALRCELLHERSAVRVTMVQMPAVNTPQFSWVLSRLPRHAQPVPPIYQPEVAARAVVFAADHPRRREYWVGSSTVGTLVANAVVPGLLDRYLGRTGFSSQQTSDLTPDDQPANLWKPADGPDGRDFGAHGAFDDRARGRSTQQWVAHRYPQLSGSRGGAGGRRPRGLGRGAPPMSPPSRDSDRLAKVERRGRGGVGRGPARGGRPALDGRDGTIRPGRWTSSRSARWGPGISSRVSRRRVRRRWASASSSGSTSSTPRRWCGWRPSTSGVGGPRWSARLRPSAPRRSTLAARRRR